MINNDHFCILDTETGGLSPAKNPICEIAFVILNNKLEEVDRYEAINKNYNDPDGKPLVYQPQALAVHGITMNEINRGISIEESIRTVDSMVSKYCKGKSKMTMICHNAAFDIPMMEYAYNYSKKDLYRYFHFTHRCTLKMSHDAWGHDDSMENFKLATCCERIGVTIADSHRGLGDVLSTVELFKHHIMNMRNPGSSQPKTNTVESDNEYGRGHQFKF